MANYSIVNINGVATPAEISYGISTAGIGNISVFTSNNTVIGNTTTFTTQLGNGYVIRDGANVYVGKISNVISNTAATLYANANISLGNVGFRFQSYTVSPINFDANTYTFTDDAHRGNGTVSVFTANSMLIGIDTIFTKQLDVGYQIFANTYSIDGGIVSLLGVIKSVTNNTQAEFTTMNAYNLTDNAYRYFNPVTTNTSNTFSKFNHEITNGLLTWARSGLIPNVKQVKSYHPPMPDPVTGILVNFPASIHTSSYPARVSRKKIGSSLLQSIDTIPESTRNNTNTVQDFNDDHGIIGSSVIKAIDSIPINSYIKKLAHSESISDSDYFSSLKIGIETIYGSSKVPLPPGLIIAANAIPDGFTQITNTKVIDTPFIAYQGPGANIVYVLNDSVISNAYPTVADQLAIAGNYPPIKRIVNTREDASIYYSKPDDKMTDAQRADLAARASDQFNSNKRKQVVISGVPAAIPGTLNVLLADENPANRVFSNASYSWGSTIVTAGFNKDLPASTLNLLPTIKTVTGGKNGWVK